MRHCTLALSCNHSSVRSNICQIRQVSARSQNPARRQLLLGLAAGAPTTTVLPGHAGEAQFEKFVSPESGFLFEYPTTWTVAIDRASMKTLGILVVAGDFNNAVTLSVTRQQLSELQLPAKFSIRQLQTSEGQLQFQEGAATAVATQANIFEFGLLSSSIRVTGNGGVYCDLEYTDSICKSEILEGLGGRRRCVDSFDNTVSTPTKHAFRTTTLGTDGFVYTATGSTYDMKWPRYQDSIRAAAQSLQVA